MHPRLCSIAAKKTWAAGTKRPAMTKKSVNRVSFLFIDKRGEALPRPQHSNAEPCAAMQKRHNQIYVVSRSGFAIDSALPANADVR
jgi:hypothetical protein